MPTNPEHLVDGYATDYVAANPDILHVCGKCWAMKQKDNSVFVDLLDINARGVFECPTHGEDVGAD